MDAVVNPPQPNEPSYDLHEKVTDAFLVTTCVFFGRATQNLLS